MTNTPTELSEAEENAWLDQKTAIQNEICGGSDRQTDVINWMVNQLTDGGWTEEEYDEQFQSHSTDLDEIREKTQNLYDAYMRAKPWSNPISDHVIWNDSPWEMDLHDEEWECFTQGDEHVIAAIKGLEDHLHPFASAGEWVGLARFCTSMAKDCIERDLQSVIYSDESKYKQIIPGMAMEDARIGLALEQLALFDTPLDVKAKSDELRRQAAEEEEDDDGEDAHI